MTSNRYSVRKLILALVSVLVVSNIFTGKVLEVQAYQDARAALNFCVTENPGISSFPDTNLVFRAYDQSLNPIADISARDLRVSENGQAPVQLQDGMQVNTTDLGIDFHIIVNRGNRTDQSIVKTILSSFLRYYDQSKDQVYIYTDDGNSLIDYYTPSLGIPLAQVVSEYPTDRVSGYRVVDTAVRGVLAELDVTKDNCQRPRFLFLLMGDDAISEDNFVEYSENAVLTNTKIVVFHIPTENGGVRLESSYRDFVERSGGRYVLANNEDVTPFLSAISSYRQTYEIKYRSTQGESEQRSLSFMYQGVMYPAKGNGVYSIGVLPPQLTVIVPSIVERITTDVVDGGYIYDIRDVAASVQVTFPDQFPRNIETIALIINQPGKPELRIPVEITSSNGDTYKFSWPLGDIGDARQIDISLKVEVVDDLGIVASSPDVPVIVANYVRIEHGVQRYPLYVTSGIILLLLIAVALLWRRLKNSSFGQRVTSVAEGFRKTITNMARGKPLASLRIIEGPQNMINQELKIYTESVKLGRDPRKADMTFYGADVNSTVSGLHAQIERVNKAWRIVAVSASKSETFIDEIQIPFNEPKPLSSGQIVRLGYPAQQPVVFEFLEYIQSPPKKKDESPSTTEFGDKTLPNQPSRNSKTPQLNGQEDNIFDEYRDS